MPTLAAALSRLLRRVFPKRSQSLRRLEQLVRGDVEKAQRLVAYELKRDSGLSQSEAIERAIGRLEYDRTR